MNDTNIAIDMTQPNMAVKVNLLQCIHALNIELLTGMKATRGGSILKHAQAVHGVTSKNKKGAVKELVEKLQTIDPDYVPSPSVARTLNS